MKRMIFILTLLVFCVQINGLAQASRAGFSVSGVMANMRGTVDGESQKGKTTSGFAVGVLVDVPIKKSHFSFQPVMQYIHKGRIAQEGSTTDDKITYELRYAELLMNFLYNTNSANGNFFIGAGPSLSFNLPSKTVTETPAGIKSEAGITFGNLIANKFRGVDYGVNAVIGYRVKGGFFISANYTMGLRNLVPSESLSEGDIKNNSFGINLGWLINNK